MDASDVSMRIMFPLEKVRADLRMVLAEGKWKIEMEDGVVDVSPETSADIVSRSHHVYEYPVGFGSHYRVLVGLGGVSCGSNGVVRAVLCFATLWYAEKGDVITVDFSRTPP